MKQKLVVAMSVLGLVSCPAFAATQTKHVKHHVVKHQTVSETNDYKAMGALPAGCPVDPYQAVMVKMSQNTGRAMPTDACNKLIAIAGGINFDAKWGNRSIGYQGENVNRLSLDDAYLNAVGNVNDWTTAFMSVSYSNFSNALVSALNPVTGQRPGNYSNAYTNNSLNLEQGYITFKNWNYAPVFVQVGKQFEDFGRYTIHPIERTMDQVLSETLQTTAEVGFLTSLAPQGSLHGDVYAFNNPMKKVGQAHTKTNWGAALGYDQISDQLGWDLGAGYIYNMTGVNDVAYAVGVFNGSGSTGTYTNRVGALAAYGDVNSGPFSVGVRYVTSLQTFSPTDLTNKAGGTNGASPWAAGITAGYGFMGWDRSQNVYLGYQASNNAVEVSLPRSRWILGYGVDVWKNTNLGLEVGHDIDYSTSDGATGSSSNTVGLRVGVKFG